MGDTPINLKSLKDKPLDSSTKTTVKPMVIKSNNDPAELAEYVINALSVSAHYLNNTPNTSEVNNTMQHNHTNNTNNNNIQSVQNIKTIFNVNTSIETNCNTSTKKSFAGQHSMRPSPKKHQAIVFNSIDNIP